MSSDDVHAGVTVLAHGGGAPEVAMIGLPVLIFGAFFYLEKRARAREKGDE